MWASIDVGLSSDIITGFCNETEEEHADTVSLMKAVKYDQAFMFAYSMREKTHAHRNYKYCLFVFFFFQLERAEICVCVCVCEHNTNGWLVGWCVCERERDEREIQILAMP